MLNPRIANVFLASYSLPEATEDDTRELRKITPLDRI